MFLVDMYHGKAVRAASARGHKIVVRMLLKKGADLDALVRWMDTVATSCTRRRQESAADATGWSIHQLPRRCYCRVLQATFPSGYKKVLGHRKKRDLPCSGVS